MQIPLQITFRVIPHSDAVEAKIREKVSKLERLHSHIISCRVAVEAEHHSHHQGNQYHIRIDITTLRNELLVSREHHDKKAYEDIYVAIRDAFNAPARQLEDYARMLCKFFLCLAYLIGHQNCFVRPPISCEQPNKPLTRLL
jgi:ribosomal subunit interface protein